jgi:molybdopterin converting factor subunit 1
MRVTVQYFARLRELAGCQTWTCELADGSTIADVWRACIARHPDVEVLGASLSCALNADFSRMGAVVRDGDEVAFLPPVSGGAWTES